MDGYADIIKALNDRIWKYRNENPLIVKELEEIKEVVMERLHADEMQQKAESAFQDYINDK